MTGTVPILGFETLVLFVQGLPFVSIMFVRLSRLVV